MINILHIIGGNDNGGAGIHVLSLISTLTKDPEIKIHLVCLGDGILAQKAINARINTTIVKTSRFIIPETTKIIELTKKNKYDIVHSHGTRANLVALILKIATNAIIATTIHSDYKLDYKHCFYKHITIGLLNRITIRFFTHYIAVSNNFKKMLISRKFNAKKISVLYNGIDFETPIPNSKSHSIDTFANKHNITMKKNTTLVGMLIRLHPVKDVSTFLLAAKEVLNHNSNIAFLIAGDGPQKEALVYRAKTLGISDKVYFLGYIEHPNAFLSILDINVMTSLSESFPYTLLEGARLKKATISSNVGGIPELINSGIDGYLFNPKDYKQLASHILSLSNNHEEKTEMGNKLYQKAKTSFSVIKMAKTQKKIYQVILGIRA